MRARHVLGGILVLFLSIIIAILYIVIATAFSSFHISIAFGVGAVISAALAAVAVLLGILILVFALRMKTHPETSQTAGVVVLVCALLSFIGGGGFYIGAILALVGGNLALIWKRPAATTS
ncbi:MAG: DUF6114 domain-containing protein [Thermoplasmatales archaeon]|nr:DUF6114 domain-containing protein [Thermoplasmatales archaeon]